MKRPELHSFVIHKHSGLKAQVFKHFIDEANAVGVIVTPQRGASRDNIYRIWFIHEIQPLQLPLAAASSNLPE